MAAKVEKTGGRFVVKVGGRVATTPMGTPVESGHQALIREVADAIDAHGLDPTARTSMYSLHATYLDFGGMVPREELIASIAGLWPSDLFVHRPADPDLAMPLLALWGPLKVDRAGFVEALGQLKLRQIMAVMVAGATFGSAVLGLKVVTTQDRLDDLARGACGRFMSFLQSQVPNGVCFGGSNRREPWDMDEAYCAEHCCVKRPRKDARFADRCEVCVVLSMIRRYSTFEEE